MALTEIGHIGVIDSNGDEYTFAPTFANIAKIGSPSEIVHVFAELHSRVALRVAMLVMTCCGDNSDGASKLIGWLDSDLKRVDGAIPDDDLIVFAKALMQDGIAGRAKPSANSAEGQYSATFDASEFVDAAMVHLKLSATDAWNLTMTQFQRQFDMKYPSKKKADMTESEYTKAKNDLKAKIAGAGL